MGVFLFDENEGKIPGVVYDDPNEIFLPNSLINMVDRLYILPQFIFLLEVHTSPRPFDEKLVSCFKHAHQILHVVVEVGYAQARKTPDSIIKSAFKFLGQPCFDDNEILYFVSRNIFQIPKITYKYPIFFVYDVMKRLLANRPKNITLPEEFVVEISKNIHLS